MEELAWIIREAMLDRGLVEVDLERLVHGEVDRAAITRIVHADADAEGAGWWAMRTVAHELGCDVGRLERLWQSAGLPVGPVATFGRRLRGRREELGLSQRRAAVRMGVSKTAYWRYEHDRSLPDAGRLPALARALRIPRSQLGRWLNDSPLRTDATNKTLRARDGGQHGTDGGE